MQKVGWRWSRFTHNLESSDTLVNVNYSSTGLGIPNMENSTSLKIITSSFIWWWEKNPLVSGTTYRFNNCNALENLNFYGN